MIQRPPRASSEKASGAEQPPTCNAAFVHRVMGNLWGGRARRRRRGVGRMRRGREEEMEEEVEEEEGEKGGEGV